MGDITTHSMQLFSKKHFHFLEERVCVISMEAIELDREWGTGEHVGIRLQKGKHGREMEERLDALFRAYTLDVPQDYVLHVARKNCCDMWSYYLWEVAYGISKRAPQTAAPEDCELFSVGLKERTPKDYPGIEIKSFVCDGGETFYVRLNQDSFYSRNRLEDDFRHWIRDCFNDGHLVVTSQKEWFGEMLWVVRYRFE